MDILRGIAISVMVWGHLGVAIYHPDGVGVTGESFPATTVPSAVEVVGGLAPTMFVLLAGMMVAYGRRGGLAKQLKRWALLWLAGALVDVVMWRLRPFTSVDVLYVLGLVLPVAHVFVTKVPKAWRWPVALAVLLVTPVLQRWLGFADLPTEYTLAGKLMPFEGHRTSIVQHWLVDGWFPIFPWVGVGLIGAQLGMARSEGRKPPTARDFAFAVGVVVAGIGMGFPWATGFPWRIERLFLRVQAGGAFMPATLDYLVATVGFTLLLLRLADLAARKADHFSLLPMMYASRGSLYIYVGHFLVVKAVASLLGERVGLLGWVAISSLCVGGLAAAVAIVQAIYVRVVPAAPP